MKRLAYILSFYILFCAVAPCCLFDTCGETELIAQGKADPLKECNNCSPFSTCAACHGFAYRQETWSVKPFTTQVIAPGKHYAFNCTEGVDEALFQPPRTV